MGSLVGWVGARTGCFAWLRRRITDAGFEIYDFDSGASARLQRLIIATTDRISIDRHISDLSAFEEVPTALATDSWWMGSGRTGLREFPQPLLPWFRWWESWHPWLHGESQQYFSALPHRHMHAIVASGCNSNRQRGQSELPLGRLAIIGHCVRTISGWKEVAETAGWEVTLLSPTNLEPMADSEKKWSTSPSFSLADQNEYDHVLWDDSSLNTCNREGRGAPDSIKRILKRIRSSFPDATIVAACSLPHWNEWESMQQAGAQEILTKPETGLGLARLLSAKTLAAQA